MGRLPPLSTKNDEDINKQAPSFESIVNAQLSLWARNTHIIHDLVKIVRIVLYSTYYLLNSRLVANGSAKSHPLEPAEHGDTRLPHSQAKPKSQIPNPRGALATPNKGGVAPVPRRSAEPQGFSGEFLPRRPRFRGRVSQG